MKFRLLITGLFLVTTPILYAQEEHYPNSRSPENPIPAVREEPEVQPPKRNQAPKNRINFKIRQKRGQNAYGKFVKELDQMKIEYHSRMIYQIKQNRRLEKKRQKYKYTGPADVCYPVKKYRRKRFLFW